MGARTAGNPGAQLTLVCLFGFGGIVALWNEYANGNNAHCQLSAEQHDQPCRPTADLARLVLFRGKEQTS